MEESKGKKNRNENRKRTGMESKYEQTRKRTEPRWKPNRNRTRAEPEKEPNGGTKKGNPVEESNWKKSGKENQKQVGTEPE